MHFSHYVLRLVEPGDAPEFFQLIDRNRTRLEDFFSGTVARTRTREETQAYVEEILQRIVARTYLPHFLIDTRSDSFAGFIDVKNIDWNIPKGELGCFIDSSLEGKGIASAAFNVMVRYLMKDMGFQKLYLRTSPANLSAKALAEKTGFRQEGLLRNDYKTTQGQLVDLVYYGLLQSELV